MRNAKPTVEAASRAGGASPWSEYFSPECLAGLSVKAEDVACRVSEARGDFGGVGSDRLDDLAAVGHNRVKGR
jgi:hypothetical protein